MTLSYSRSSRANLVSVTRITTPSERIIWLAMPCGHLSAAVVDLLRMSELRPAVRRGFCKPASNIRNRLPGGVTRVRDSNARRKRRKRGTPRLGETPLATRTHRGSRSAQSGSRWTAAVSLCACVRRPTRNLVTAKCDGGLVPALRTLFLSPYWLIYLS